jgi:hypothetical protein
MCALSLKLGQGNVEEKLEKSQLFEGAQHNRGAWGGNGTPSMADIS